MHYLLVHFDIPSLSPDSYELTVDGNVRSPLTLSLEDVRSRPARTLTVTMECAGNGRALLQPRPVSQPWLVEAIGTAEWTGTPLASVLRDAGLLDGTMEIVFTGADHGIQGDVEQDYQRSLSPDEAMREDVLLAYEMNGRPLEPQHGAPLRLLVPGWYGMTSVKWLTRITATTRPFDGYQMRGSYVYQSSPDEPGEPVQRMRVRALMLPPGYPEFATRRRFVTAGRVLLEGRAWRGSGAITRVEVGVDGEWRDATLGPDAGEYAWRGWSFAWDARPGDHVLSCRATDAAGDVQPEQAEWNWGGFGNNSVQTVDVTVR
jgi:DMSO/TMAO reductase YedYZ molybdopterin-dependent catalytic subunit